MDHKEQIREFYFSLKEDERKDLNRALAEDIYFLDQEIQTSVMMLIEETIPEAASEIKRINCFTI